MALLSNNSHPGRGTGHPARAILVGILLGSSLLGCTVSPAAQEATRRAWAERDAVRERECLRAGQGRWVAGGCVLGGGSGGM
jgi:hypothetical protein